MVLALLLQLGAVLDPYPGVCGLETRTENGVTFQEYVLDTHYVSCCTVLMDSRVKLNVFFCFSYIKHKHFICLLVHQCTRVFMHGLGCDNIHVHRKSLLRLPERLALTLFFS